jgi:hypothetical protein
MHRHPQVGAGCPLRLRHDGHAAAAIALSEHEGCAYRTVDRRWTEEPLVETFDSGAQV